MCSRTEDACARVPGATQALVCRCLRLRVPEDQGIGAHVCSGRVHASARVVMCLCLRWCTPVPEDQSIGARVCPGIRVLLHMCA